MGSAWLKATLGTWQILLLNFFTTNPSIDIAAKSKNANKNVGAQLNTILITEIATVQRF